MSVHTRRKHDSDKYGTYISVLFASLGQSVMAKTVHERTRRMAQFSQYAPTKVSKKHVYFCLYGIALETTFVENFN